MVYPDNAIAGAYSPKAEAAAAASSRVLVSRRPTVPDRSRLKRVSVVSTHKATLAA